MRTYLYFSMTPESLVASMLPPKEFGNYLAIGTRQSTHGEAMFFDIKEGFECEYIDRTYIADHCVPHPDGRPKHSLYLGVYRVLERMPLEALGSLWLVTARGEVLELEAAAALPTFSERYHLYQELCPVHPLIASSLTPRQFGCFLTNPRQAFSVPRICFVNLHLGEMAMDPQHGQPRELFYPDDFWHVRQCLLELNGEEGKRTKTVDRLRPPYVPYHSIKDGFFVSDQQGMLYYPFPLRAELESKYYYWWRRSAHR